MADWIAMFVKKPFEYVDDMIKADIISETERILRDKLCVDGIWIVDYVRLRIRAVKPLR